MTTLKLDLDRAQLPRSIDRRIATVAWVLGWRVHEYSFRRTRRGWHVRIEIDNRVHIMAVIAVQAILGSDPMRELCNVLRARRWRRLSPYWRKRINTLYLSHGPL